MSCSIGLLQHFAAPFRYYPSPVLVLNSQEFEAVLEKMVSQKRSSRETRFSLRYGGIGQKSSHNSGLSIRILGRSPQPPFPPKLSAQEGLVSIILWTYPEYKYDALKSGMSSKTFGQCLCSQGDV